MSKDVTKRSYYFPNEVLKLWEEFHKPSKDFSPSAAAAFLLYMACDAETREIIRKAAFKNPEEIIKQIKVVIKTDGKNVRNN